MEQTLDFIGRGSAFNIKEGNTSAYIEHGKDLFLFDCGETVFSKIVEKNLLDGIENLFVLVTHCHSDHIGSLSSLLYYCQYVKKIKVTIHSRVSTAHTLNGILQFQGNAKGEQVTFLYVGEKLREVNNS